MKRNNIRKLCIIALLAALGAVFSAFLSIEIAPAGFKTVEISLTPVPVMIAGMLFGPLAGALTGCVADFAGFFMGVQHGAYNPFFTVTMALFGVIAGLFYLKSPGNSIWKVTALTSLAQLVVSVILNTMAIHLFYNVPLKALLPVRLISALIELPLYAWLLMMLSEGLRPVMAKLLKAGNAA